MGYGRVARMLVNGNVVVHDGSFGTELVRRGVRGANDPYIWSARGLLDAPNIALDIHRDYVLAGADVITAGAFRTNSRALRKAGLDNLSRPLTLFAVSIARQVREEFGNQHDFAVAGNLTSVEDCYDPKVSPVMDAYAEHVEKVDYLMEAGSDFVLIESMPSAVEAAAALKASRDVMRKKRRQIPVWVSLILSGDGKKHRPTFVDGTPVEDIRKVLENLSGGLPNAILLNCSFPEAISSAIPILVRTMSASKTPVGAYANVERQLEPRGSWIRREDISPSRYAEFAVQWIEMGVQIVGGCCGTTPDDIRAIRNAVSR